MCSGSGSCGILDGGGKGWTPDATLAIVGDVGGAECDLGGDVRECGISMGAIDGEGMTSASGRSRSEESGLEGTKGSSRLGEADCSEPCTES